MPVRAVPGRTDDTVCTVAALPARSSAALHDVQHTLRGLSGFMMFRRRAERGR